MYPDAVEAPSDSRPAGWRARLARAGLLALMSVLTLNLFTGSPLASLWVGSQVQGDGAPKMEAVFAFIGCFGVFSFVLVKLLAAAGRAHDRLAGRRPTVRAHLPWLRSLRGERPHEAGAKAGLSALDVILILAVAVVVLAFELWFFFMSGSPIDQRSGR